MRVEWQTVLNHETNQLEGFWQAATNQYEFVARGDSPLEAVMALAIVLASELGLVD